jgi:hypothetical protein
MAQAAPVLDKLVMGPPLSSSVGEKTTFQAHEAARSPPENGHAPLAQPPIPESRPEHDDTASDFVSSPVEENFSPMEDGNPIEADAVPAVSPYPGFANNHPASLASYLTIHPNRPVRKAVKHLYPRAPAIIRLLRRFKVRHDVICGLTEKEMQEWETREGKRRRKEAGWRLESEVDERLDGNGVERAVVSPLFWKVSTTSQQQTKPALACSDHLCTRPRPRCTLPSFQHYNAIHCPV